MADEKTIQIPRADKPSLMEMQQAAACLFNQAASVKYPDAKAAYIQVGSWLRDIVEGRSET